LEKIFRNLRIKMANPHHRPKHKQYVHQKHIAQQHHEQSIPAKSAKKAALPLAIIGAVAGLLVAYIANKESILALTGGLIAGAIVGYLFGGNIDKVLKKK
jgi:flagellar motor component MotA